MAGTYPALPALAAQCLLLIPPLFGALTTVLVLYAPRPVVPIPTFPLPTAFLRQPQCFLIGDLGDVAFPEHSICWRAAHGYSIPALALVDLGTGLGYRSLLEKKPPPQLPAHVLLHVLYSIFAMAYSVLNVSSFLFFSFPPPRHGTTRSFSPTSRFLSQQPSFFFKPSPGRLDAPF